MTRTATPPVYELLAGEAARIGWPRLFQTDLTGHDRRALDEHPQEGQFVWVLREHGTHIYFIEPAANRQAAEWHIGLLRYHQRHEQCRWYIGDSGRRTLTPTTAAEAIRRYLAAQPQEQPAAPALSRRPDWAGRLYGATA